MDKSGFVELFVVIICVLGNGVAAWLGAQQSPVIGAVVIGILTLLESLFATKKIRDARGATEGEKAVIYS